MTLISVKSLSILFAAVALIAGLILGWHGSTYQAVFDLTSLSLPQVRDIFAIRLFQILLGAGTLVVAVESYRFSRQQF